MVYERNLPKSIVSVKQATTKLPKICFCKALDYRLSLMDFQPAQRIGHTHTHTDGTPPVPRRAAVCPARHPPPPMSNMGAASDTIVVNKESGNDIRKGTSTLQGGCLYECCWLLSAASDMTDAAQRGSWSPNVMDVIVAERDGRRHSLSPCCGDWPPNYGCASRLSKTLPLSGTGRLTDCLALLAPVACQTRHSTLAAKLVMRLSMSDH